VGWLSQFDGGLEHVRRLFLIDWDPADPEPAYADLLLRCTKLAELTLEAPVGGPTEKSFVCLESARRFVNDRQVEVLPHHIEYAETYRDLRRLRSLEWWQSGVGRLMKFVSQFKLLLGSSVEVYLHQSLGYYNYQKELVTEELTVGEVQYLEKYILYTKMKSNLKMYPRSTVALSTI
jgi:hypothetical protein